MIERSLPAGPQHVVRVRCTDRSDGDFRIDGPATALARVRQAVAPGEWTWLHQVHGVRVVAVERPGDGAGAEADAAVTVVPGAVLAVQTADCAPVVFAGNGVLAVAHAGWRGIVGGVLRAAADAVRARGGGRPCALLGPCIHPAGYEFGDAELEAVVAVCGPGARGHTSRGRPALDLPAAVRGALAEAGVDDVIDVGLDTAGSNWFSHRTRGDEGRQTTVAWMEPM